MAWGFSSLAITQASEWCLKTSRFTARTSSAVLMKEAATMFTFVLHAEFKVGLVFFGERGHAHDGARKIDALMLPKHSAIDDIAFHVVAAQIFHPQFNQSIDSRMREPGSTSWARVLKVVEIRPEVRECPGSNGDLSAGFEGDGVRNFSRPVRIFGP